MIFTKKIVVSAAVSLIAALTFAGLPASADDDKANSPSTKWTVPYGASYSCDDMACACAKAEELNRDTQTKRCELLGQSLVSLESEPCDDLWAAASETEGQASVKSTGQCSGE